MGKRKNGTKTKRFTESHFQFGGFPKVGIDSFHGRIINQFFTSTCDGLGELRLLQDNFLKLNYFISQIPAHNNLQPKKTYRSLRKRKE